MMKYLEKNEQLNKQPHDFTRKRPCLTNLLESFEEWTATVDEGYGLDGYGLDVVSLDLRKLLI